MQRNIKVGVIALLTGISLSTFSSCNTYKSATKIESQMGNVKGVYWTLKELNGKSIERFTSKLYLEDGKGGNVNLKTPCNGYFGSYTVNPNLKFIQFSGMAGTMKLCGQDEMKIEKELVEIFNSSKVHYEVNSNELRLFKKGKQVAIYENVSTADQIAYLKSNKWKMTWMENVGQKYSQTIEFSEKDGKLVVNGFAGCNGYSGGAKVDGAKIMFEQIISTMKGCVDSELTRQENYILSTLRSEDLTFDISDKTFRILNNGRSALAFSAL